VPTDRVALCALQVRIVLQNAVRFARHETSGSKKRFLDLANGFDLDLTYVVTNSTGSTPGGGRLIAMSLPSTGLRMLYRNPLHEVARLLETRHGKQGYVIINCVRRRPLTTAPHHRPLTTAPNRRPRTAAAPNRRPRNRRPLAVEQRTRRDASPAKRYAARRSQTRRDAARRLVSVLCLRVRSARSCPTVSTTSSSRRARCASSTSRTTRRRRSANAATF
jgi:hypothetical protein